MNLVAQKAACAALRDDSHVRRTLELIKKEKKCIRMLSELFIALILLSFIIPDHSFRALGRAPYLLFFLIALLLFLIFGKILVHRRGNNAPTSWSGIVACLLADDPLLTAGLFVPFPLLFAWWVAVGRPFSFARAEMNSRLQSPFIPYAGLTMKPAPFLASRAATSGTLRS